MPDPKYIGADTPDAVKVQPSQAYPGWIYVMVFHVTMNPEAARQLANAIWSLAARTEPGHQVSNQDLDDIERWASVERRIHSHQAGVSIDTPVLLAAIRELRALRARDPAAWAVEENDGTLSIATPDRNDAEASCQSMQGEHVIPLYRGLP